MASMASSTRDTSKASGYSFAAVAMSVPAVTKVRPLPTPPNSISPNLPPHGDKPYGTRSATAQLALEHVDSDLDLQDSLGGSEHDGSADTGMAIGSPGFDAAGAITPALLARHYLPDILLNQSPLAIRHIMGCLTSAVPGFSGIPPAKARRLVVGALEGRGSGGELGGLNQDVIFEKVGWGRWDARLKGRPVKHNRGRQVSPPLSVPSSYATGMPIAQRPGHDADRTRLTAPGSSWAGDSAVFSHDDDMDLTMLEHEADKMSLDGSCSSSEAPPDEPMLDNPDDVTDDEDWAAVGAAALRANSYSASGPGRNMLSHHVYTGGSYGGGRPSISVMAKSVPMQPSRLTQRPNDLDLSAYGMASDSQEREAIEALLRLGSV